MNTRDSRVFIKLAAIALRDVERVQQWPAQRGMLRVVVTRHLLIMPGVATEAPEQITDVV